MDTSSIMGTPSGPGGQSTPLAAKLIAAFSIGCVGLSILVAVAAFALPSLLNPLTKSWFDIDLDPTVVPPGDIRAFDPVETFAAVKAYAGEGAELTEISATYVRSNGTLDLKADLQPSPNVTYSFFREISAGPDAPPIGAGVSASGTQWQTISVNVGNPDKMTYVTRMGGKVNAKYQYRNKGMKKDESSPQGSNYDTAIPAPKCAFSSLWKEAVLRGAPEKAVAVIDYDKEGYEFTIRDTDFRMEFGMNCVVTSFKGQELSARGKPVEHLSFVDAKEIAKEELKTRGVSTEEGGLPPVRFVMDSEGDDWYVARQVEGSGVAGIFSAICLRIESDRTVTDAGTYEHAAGTPMVRSLNLKTCSPE